MKKNVLFIVGSKNDIDKKGTPTKAIDDLLEAVDKKNSQDPEKQLDYHIAVCSEDRTPFNLPAILNERKYDGIIGHGGLSLVLAAGLVRTMNEMREGGNIWDFRTEIKDFMESGDKKSPYSPGNHSINFISEDNSKYRNNQSYIPIIGVPGKDTASQGVTSFLSIVENPPGCEPRPAVGLNRVDSAVNSMYEMLFKKYKGVSLIYDEKSEESMQGASKVVQRLKTFGLLKCGLATSSEVINGGLNQHSEELMVYVGDYNPPRDLGDERTDIGFPGYGDIDNPTNPIVKDLDTKVNFLINVPVKKDMSDFFKPYLNDISRLNNTVSVGIGNYDNAAILAAQLIDQPEIKGGMWEYRHSKTKSGVVDDPVWLSQGKVDKTKIGGK